MNAAHELILSPAASGLRDGDSSGLVERAMTSARAAQALWSRTALVHRLKLVRKLRHLLVQHAEQLAEASAAPRQRPSLESLTAEVLPLVEACRFLERNTEKLLAPRRLGKKSLTIWLAGVRSQVLREPFGVVLIIAPGNYPLLLPGVQLIQALVAGNAVLLKPGIGGTPAARALCALMLRAGFDSQLIALLPESTEAARTAISMRPDKVLFTGSANTGEAILTQLAPHLIPSTMELSGSDAVILRADADLDLAVKALLFGLSLNAGATCMAPRRAFVPHRLATELEGRLANSFRGNGGETGQRLTMTVDKRLRSLLEDAVAQGAHFVAGKILDDGGIATPIILAGVSPASRLLREDIFAPVLSIITVTDDHDAITCANDCPFALTASIFSRDEATARSLASQIQAGVVTINDLILPTADAQLPFGGRRRSGFGVTRGAEGLLELTTSKVVTVTRGTFRPAFDPPHPGDGKMFHAYLKLAHGREWKSRWHALISLIRIISRRQKASTHKIK